MYRIMFVCHGNICRSPMAEFIFKKLLSDRGLTDEFAAFSSATSAEEIYNGVGNPVYSPARAELLKHGVRCDGKRAVQLQRSDKDLYDIFVGMDNMNVRNMRRILGEDCSDRIYRLMDFTARPGEVSDPWYSDRFDVAYRDIYDGCVALLDKMTTKDYK